MPIIEQSLIDTVLNTGPWRSLNDYEKATPYRQDQARAVIEVVRAADDRGVIGRVQAICERMVEATGDEPTDHTGTRAWAAEIRAALRAAS